MRPTLRRLVGLAFLLGLTSLPPCPALAQESGRRLAGYHAPKGFKLQLVAEAPVVGQPVAMAFADDGSLFVIEWTTTSLKQLREQVVTFKYRDGSTRQFAMPGKSKKDVVKLLTFDRDKGAYTRSRVVLEDELPSAILFHDGWLYLAGRGSVRRYRQSKADGPYDKREVVAQGFGGFGLHSASGLAVGPDGWLYISAGDGDNYVEGSDGSRATVLRTGAIFRCRPDGSKLHTFATGFQGPLRDVAFDLAGNLYHADACGKSPRLLRVPEGADLGWRLAYGARCCTIDSDRVPAEKARLLGSGLGAAAGPFVYNDTRLPEEFRDLVLLPDPDGRRIRTGKKFDLLAAPKDELFRPCQVVLGPDGALYVADWRSRSSWRDRLTAVGAGGRIYRLSWAGNGDTPALPLRGLDSWAKLLQKSDAELIDALASDEASDRARARDELVRRGAKVRPALLEAFRAGKTPILGKLAALSALGALYDDEVQKVFLRALAEGDDDIRRPVVVALGLCAKKGDRAVQAALLKALSDEEPAIRRALVLSMGRVAGPGAADSLATALSFDEGKDLALHDGFVRALEMLGKPGITALLALADSGVQKDTNRVVQAVLAMRSRPAFEVLPMLLRHRHVRAAQRAELIRSALNYQLDPPVSLDALAAHLATRKDEESEVKEALLSVLGTPGTTAGPKASAWLAARLEDPGESIRLAAIAAAGRLRLARWTEPLSKRLEKGSAAEQRAAAQALGATPEGARLLGKRYVEKKLPRTLKPEVAAALRRQAAGDAEARKLLAEVLKRE